MSRPVPPEPEEEESAESRAATRKVMALISTSLVSVIDVSTYIMCRQKPGMLTLAAVPMAVVTVAVLVFAWLMLRKLPDSEPGQ